MSKLDKLIEEALSAEEREMLSGTEELGWFALGISQFTGKLGWVSWVIMVVQLALLVAGIYCAIQFFGSTEVMAALKWGLSGAILLLTSTQMKMSLMPQMQADRVLRELKRVELLIAHQRK